MFRRRRLRRQLDELLLDLDAPPSASAQDICVQLCATVARHLGLRIRLHFDDLGSDGPTGLWVSTVDQENIILVTTARSWTHRLYILTHELAHMLCGHRTAQLDNEERTELLLPAVSPERVMKVAARECMSDRHEREAEQVANMLMRALMRWAAKQQVAPLTVSSDSGSSRLRYCFEFQPGRDHRAG
ncbi:pyruvate kinase [Crossiella equi]|uniref:Pyruvate kinase n=1 Tax=Crossiella equi TaxID=130796 RepID=A0ABS5A3H8_9PSEU|nr:hypothetical protein [Crossiella equi]MBP2471142.1 pyruvate kinase [Crossiella equi]